MKIKIFTKSEEEIKQADGLFEEVSNLHDLIKTDEGKYIVITVEINSFYTTMYLSNNFDLTKHIQHIEKVHKNFNN